MFVFQAEDGIRDIGVTGVQRCALPISSAAVLGTRARPPPPSAARRPGSARRSADRTRASGRQPSRKRSSPPAADAHWGRSEERRVGKEGRSGWSPYHLKKDYLRQRILF